MDTKVLTQPQREAITDILVLTMYSDGHLSLLEDANLKKKIENLNWEEGQSSSMYLNQSIANARDADEIEEIIKIIETKAHSYCQEMSLNRDLSINGF